MSELTAEQRAELDAIAANLADLDARLAESDVATLYRALLAAPDTLDPVLGRYVYGEVAPACVDPCVREAAEKAVAWCVVEDLLLDYVPSIRWFLPESDLDRAYAARWQTRDWLHVSTKRPVRGCTVHGSNEIWLRADLSIAKVVTTAAHEVRHLAEEPGTSPGVSELDAHCYEERMGGRLRALNAEQADDRPVAEVRDGSGPQARRGTYRLRLRPLSGARVRAHRAVQPRRLHRVVRRGQRARPGRSTGRAG